MMQKQKAITVFTPTYNRAYLLPRLYDSLCGQTSNDFIWLIIDDGSTDNTKLIINEWQSINKLEINYIYKENGGLHTGYNKAIENIDTQLCMCVDSDDFVPINAVEIVLDLWRKEGSESFAGILGLDFYINGKSVGGNFPNVKSSFFIDLGIKYSYKGDVKFVHRTELLKKYIPLPTINGEKNFNPIYIFLLVDQNYPLLLLNKNLCYVDYQDDGMSNNIFNQYKNSPWSFIELRKLYISLERTNLLFKFRNSVHYISSCIFANNKRWFYDSPNKILTILAIPFGILLNLFIRYKSQ
jgi:glycosyltransferase involved in cell wall biosynthesis